MKRKIDYYFKVIAANSSKKLKENPSSSPSVQLTELK